MSKRCLGCGVQDAYAALRKTGGGEGVQNLVAALNASVDPVGLMGRIAEQMCLITPKADGAAVSILAGDTFVVVSAHGVVASMLGEAFPSEGTFVGAAVRTGCPQVSANASTDEALLPQVRELGGQLGVGALVVIPLLHRGSAIGAMSMTARDANKFGARDVAAMQAAGRFASALIASHTELASMIDEFLTDPAMTGPTDTAARFMASLLLPEVARAEQMHRQLDVLLADPSHLRAVVQPIVDLDSRVVVGYEGLTRFPGHDDLSPWQWFGLARELGRSAALEMAAMRHVFTAATVLPEECFIAVNLSPLTAMDPATHATLASCPRPLVVEITEHEPFPDHLAESLAPLRERGIRLAVDDAGAGYASFTQLLRLRPDIIKIDGTLTSGIDTDPVKRALVGAIAQLADELGACTVAEAIETPAQHHTLHRMGIHLGQGYYFGHPAPCHQSHD